MNKYPRRIKYEIGQRYQHFVIVSMAPNKIAKTGRSYTCWECLCDCGQKFITTTKQIQKGIKKSCGCRSKSNRFKPMSSDRVVGNHKFGHYKNCAKRRGISVNITLDQFISFLFGDCKYCKSPPSTCIKLQKHRVKINGVDRIDSSLGYEIDNCVSCCKICNRAKGDLSHEEFQEWINKIRST